LKEIIKTIIADDEPPARRRIAELLKVHTDIKIIVECSNGSEAVKSILKNRPDLVFLDIQMPGLNGFEVIQTIGLDQMPVVIFVTAHDKYAINAFDVNAVDYLLKPFDRSRFRVALQRARKEIAIQTGLGKPGNVDNLLIKLREDNRLRERLLIKSSGRISIVEIDNIDWVESAGNYVNIHLGKDSHLMRATMQGMERRLKDLFFARAHRKVIVNLSKIKEIWWRGYGDAVIVLRDGIKLPLSRRYRSFFTTWLR
jgi:two-component system LytT family response regulator